MRKPDLDRNRIIEMGGWDTRYFNSLIELDFLFLQFVEDQYARAWRKCSEEVMGAWLDEVSSIDRDIEDGYREPFTSQGDRLMNLEIQGEVFVAEQGDEFANRFLSTLDFDEIMFIFTYGGCYRFDEPTVSIRIDPDVADYEEEQMQRPYLSHLFRFQTNLFYSTLLLYLDMGEGQTMLTQALETAAEENRRYGESP